MKQMSPYLVRHLLEEDLGDLPVKHHRGQTFVKAPLSGHMDPPVEVGMTMDDHTIEVNDAGSSAGLLFSMGQDAPGDPGYELVMSLTQGHGVTVDFDKGLLKKRVPIAEAKEAFNQVCRIALAIQEVLPCLNPTAKDFIRERTKR